MRHPALLLAFAVVLGGCGKKAPSDREESAERKRDRATMHAALETGTYRGPGQDVAVRPVPARAEAAGPAYVWIDHVGLATIDNGTATLARFAEPPENGLPTYVTAMELDGADPVLFSARGVFKIAAGQRQDLGVPEGMGGLSNLAIAPDGTIWVGNNREGIARRKDGVWIREAVALVLAHEPRVQRPRSERDLHDRNDRDDEGDQSERSARAALRQQPRRRVIRSSRGARP